MKEQMPAMNNQSAIQCICYNPCGVTKDYQTEMVVALGASMETHWLSWGGGYGSLPEQGMPLPAPSLTPYSIQESLTLLISLTWYMFLSATADTRAGQDFL